MITIFTPTYNRAGRLPRLYESLKAQTFKDFEWFIMDDGSSDETRNLVDGWINDRLLDIRYYYQENGGKHRAINKGVQLAMGEWLFIVDSDDYLPDDSLTIANKWIETIKTDRQIVGVCGIKKDITGKSISKMDFDYIDSIPSEIRWITSEDKAEIIRTDILRHYPFPDFPGEKFCPEGLIWNRLGQKYRIRYFSEVIYCYEYMEDGLTRNSLLNRRKSPTYTTMTYKEALRLSLSYKTKIRTAINFWRFVWYSKDDRRLRDIPFYSYFLMPFGVMMAMKDSLTLRVNEKENS